MTASSPAYDASNIFAKILRGELPCHKVHEDDHTFVFMDIMPRANGHALVLPKVPSRNILDAKPEDLVHLFQMAQKVAQAAKVAFEADGITLQQFSESAGGQVIFHTHVHILPRHEGVALSPPGIKGDDAKLAQNAMILREAIARLA
jgi:histidine triad (HIT) family protein